jgi:hypothetical protein
MLVRDLSSLAPGQRAVALVIAPNQKLRGECVNYALGAIRSKPELARLLVSEAQTEFVLRRPDGHEVTFEGGVATRGGYGARGRSLTDFALDESAFFLDDTYVVNDETIFTAGMARVLPGGQTIVASTPWAEKGLLYNLWRRNFGHPVDALVAHAPTLVLHDSPMTRTIVERARAADPEKAKCEFDAVFLSTGTTSFFEGATIDSSISPEVIRSEPGDTVAAGADFGFRSDSSALVVVHRRGGKFIVGDILELRPEADAPLKPSETVRAFAERIKGKCSSVMADQHYRESIEEHLSESRLTFVSAPNTPADAYMRARLLFRDGKVQIPNNDRLIRQLREVQGRPMPGGGMSIVHPRWRTGGHGDIVAALVLALYQVSGETVAAPRPDVNSREWEEAALERRERLWREQQSGSLTEKTWARRDQGWKR